MEETKATVLQSLDGPRSPVGTIAPVTEASFDAKMARLRRCFDKYGHKFARKKRQMKKNRKRYNMFWKMGQIGKMVFDKGRAEGSAWAFLGSCEQLFKVQAHFPKAVPVSYIVRTEL